MKQRKIFLIAILIFLVNLKVFSQQTYNGSYSSNNFEGTAIYGFYEKNDERLYNGSFSFKSSDKSVTILGNFLNNKKNGSWKINLNNVTKSEMVMNYEITANSTGSFINGNLDGIWKMDRKKIVSFAKNGISEYYQNNLNALSYMFDGKNVDFDKKTTVYDNSIANFKENHFIGDFSYNVNNNKSYIKGQFDDEGYFNGIWYINYYQSNILLTQIRNYMNGVLLSITNKNNSTGDLTVIYNKEEFVTNFFNKYDKQNKYAILNDKYYVLSGVTSLENNNVLLNNAIFLWYNTKTSTKSAYVFEIDRGSNEMEIFPERIIQEDNEKSEELQENTKLELKRIEMERLERERIEKGKAEWLSFFEMRKKANYNLDVKNDSEYYLAQQQIEGIITTEMKNSELTNSTVKGEIVFSIDTIGNQSLNFSTLSSDNTEILSNIKSKIQEIKIKPIIEKGYIISTYANFIIDISYSKGSCDFKIKLKSNENTIIYLTEQPSEIVAAQIRKEYIGRNEGKYNISYSVIKISDIIIPSTRQISFKANKHIGSKIFGAIFGIFGILL